jgi:hypothetical protein
VTQDIILVPEDGCDVMRIRLEPALVGVHFDEEDEGRVGATRQNSGFFEDSLKRSPIKADKAERERCTGTSFSSSGNNLTNIAFTFENAAFNSVHDF